MLLLQLQSDSAIFERTESSTEQSLAAVERAPVSTVYGRLNSQSNCAVSALGATAMAMSQLLLLNCSELVYGQLLLLSLYRIHTFELVSTAKWCYTVG